MSKRTTRATDPLDGPVDFARFGPVRRNAFAGAGEPGGPSLLALWEMPQLATDAVLLRRGRPVKGRTRTTMVKSVRLSPEMWRDLERAARRRGLNLQQAMRAALLGWASEEAEQRADGGAKAPRAERRRRARGRGARGESSKR